jgi:hypothetical protein
VNFQNFRVGISKVFRTFRKLYVVVLGPTKKSPRSAGRKPNENGNFILIFLEAKKKTITV